MRGTMIWMTSMCVFSISLIAALMLAGTAMGEISRDGLVGEWLFDGDAKDSSGYGNDGTVYRAKFVQGIREQALSFDGIDNYVNAGESNSLKITGDQLTMMAWINVYKWKYSSFKERKRKHW